MSDTLRQIVDNYYGGDTSTEIYLYNNSYLYFLAYFLSPGGYVPSGDLLRDILIAVGGDPSTSTDYLRDIAIESGQDTTVNGNWMEAWLLATTGPIPFSNDRITEIGDSRFTEDSLNERVTEVA